MIWIVIVIVAVGLIIAKSVKDSSIRQTQVATALQERNEQIAAEQQQKNEKLEAEKEQLKINKEIEKRFPRGSEEGQALLDYLLLYRHIQDTGYEVKKSKGIIAKKELWPGSVKTAKNNLPRYEKQLKQYELEMRKKEKFYEKGFDPRTVPVKYYPLVEAGIWAAANRDRTKDY